MSISTQLILEEARRSSYRAAFSFVVLVSGFCALIIALATGFDLIGW